MRNDNILNLRGYGDIESLKDDSKTLREIWSRQGTSFLLDVFADCTGETANKFKLSEVERNGLITNISADLKNALSERL